MYHLYTLFGEVYGQGSYSSGVYSSRTAPAGTDSGQPGALVDTGFGVLVAVTLSCAIIFVTMAVRLWKRPARVKK